MLVVERSGVLYSQGLLAVLRKVKWTIVHHALYIVANIWHKAELPLAHLSKLVPVCLIDILIENVDVIVSIWSHVLVPQPDGMAH